MANVLVGFVLLGLTGPIILAGFDLCVESGGCTAFAAAWGDAQLIDGLKNSLRVAVPAALLASCWAFLLEARLLVSGSSLGRRARGLALVLVFLPILFPELILAVLYTSAFRTFGIGGGLLPLVMAYLITGVPLAQLLLRQMRNETLASLVESARDLGATQTTIIRHVVLPISKGPLATVGALLLLLYLNEFVIAFFLLGPGQSTFSVVVFTSLRFGMRPETQALIITVALVTAVLGGALGLYYFSPRRLPGGRST